VEKKLFPVLSSYAATAQIDEENGDSCNAESIGTSRKINKMVDGSNTIQHLLRLQCL